MRNTSALKNEVNGIVGSLKYLGSKGVNDYERQSEVLNQQLAIAISQNNQHAVRALQQKLDTLGKYGGEFLSLKNALEFKTEQLTLLKTKYQEAKGGCGTVSSSEIYCEQCLQSRDQIIPDKVDHTGCHSLYSLLYGST